jgi:hypothetical protein
MPFYINSLKITVKISFEIDILLLQYINTNIIKKCYNFCMKILIIMIIQIVHIDEVTKYVSLNIFMLKQILFFIK